METLAELERGIRHTDGVPVLIGDVPTWGHVDATPLQGFGAPGMVPSATSGGVAPLARVVSIPRQALPALQFGAEITVDGVVEVVQAFATAPGDGALLRILLFDWTHQVDVYRHGAAGVTGTGRRTSGWTKVASAVWILLTPDAGGLESTPSGEVVNLPARAHFLSGADVQHRDGLVVVQGGGPARYRVGAVVDYGPTWGIFAALTVTQEVFP